MIFSMARRSVHYEAAFEDYVRSRGWPYVAVNEQRKALFAGARIKSFDYLVYPSNGPAWLADVKGRQFPYELSSGRRYWENWVTRDDLADLKKWEGVFGNGFRGMLVFVYWLRGLSHVDRMESVHMFREQYYAFVSIPAEEYELHAHGRSPSWDTVAMPLREFRSRVCPLNVA